MAGDGRGAAWVNGWQALAAAGELRKRFVEAEGDTMMPDAYWALLGEANGYIGLASTDVLVGMGGGEWLLAENKRKREEAARNLDFLGRVEHTARGDDLHDDGVDDV